MKLFGENSDDYAQKILDSYYRETGSEDVPNGEKTA
jgi:hypothetical protein